MQQQEALDRARGITTKRKGLFYTGRALMLLGLLTLLATPVAMIAPFFSLDHMADVAHSGGRHLAIINYLAIGGTLLLILGAAISRINTP